MKVTKNRAPLKCRLSVGTFVHLVFPHLPSPLPIPSQEVKINPKQRWNSNREPVFRNRSTTWHKLHALVYRLLSPRGSSVPKSEAWSVLVDDSCCLTSRGSPVEIKSSEVELGSHSRMDSLATVATDNSTYTQLMSYETLQFKFSVALRPQRPQGP